MVRGLYVSAALYENRLGVERVLPYAVTEIRRLALDIVERQPPQLDHMDCSELSRSTQLTSVPCNR